MTGLCRGHGSDRLDADSEPCHANRRPMQLVSCGRRRSRHGGRRCDSDHHRPERAPHLLCSPDSENRAHIARACVHGYMDIPPLPPARGTVLADLPLAIAAKFDAGTVDQQVQGPTRCTIRDLNRDPCLPSARCREVRYRPVKPAIGIRLSTRPTVWRSGIPKSTFSVRQVWIAASETSRDGPACRTSTHARPCRDRTRPTASLACAALRYTPISSLCESGDMEDSTWTSATSLDVRTESLPIFATTSF